jgi:hypothetical protein
VRAHGRSLAGYAGAFLTGLVTSGRWRRCASGLWVGSQLREMQHPRGGRVRAPQGPPSRRQGSLGLRNSANHSFVALFDHQTHVTLSRRVKVAEWCVVTESVEVVAHEAKYAVGELSARVGQLPPPTSRCRRAGPCFAEAASLCIRPAMEALANEQPSLVLVVLEQHNRVKMRALPSGTRSLRERRLASAVHAVTRTSGRCGNSVRRRLSSRERGTEALSRQGGRPWRAVGSAGVVNRPPEGLA